MKIQIIDAVVCEACQTKRCKFLNVENKKTDFYGLLSETVVCPTDAIGEEGPAKAKGGCIPTDKCVECGLCTVFCAKNNLCIKEYDSEHNKFGDLTEMQLKAVTSMYLSRIFRFAANTNRNSSLSFDGYVEAENGEQAFVEIDFGDDSLESVRRILGDIIIYNKHKIKNGIVIMSHLPQRGTNDVYTVIEKLSKFPTTADIRIYFTTFNILRGYCLSKIPAERSFSKLLYDPLTDSKKYFNRMR